MKCDDCYYVKPVIRDDVTTGLPIKAELHCTHIKRRGPYHRYVRALPSSCYLYVEREKEMYRLELKKQELEKQYDNFLIRMEMYEHKEFD